MAKRRMKNERLKVRWCFACPFFCEMGSEEWKCYHPLVTRGDPQPWDDMLIAGIPLDCPLRVQKVVVELEVRDGD